MGSRIRDDAALKEKLTCRVGRSSGLAQRRVYGFIAGGGKNVFHISAVEKAGLSSLSEGAKISFDLVANRNGKESAENLRVS